MYRNVSYLLFSFALLILFTMGNTSSITDEAIFIAQDEPDSYTLEELSQYSGEEDQLAYIVIDGIVYDVTDVEEWENNLEQDYPAGQDVTEIIQGNPIRGIILEKALEVGVLR